MPSVSISEPSEGSSSGSAGSSGASSSGGSGGTSGSSMSTSGAYNGPKSIVPVNVANGDFKLAKTDMLTNLFNAKRNKVFNNPTKEDTGITVARAIHQIRNNSFIPKKIMLPKAPHVVAKLKKL